LFDIFIGHLRKTAVSIFVFFIRKENPRVVWLVFMYGEPLGGQ
jgi:hypothetical protein